MNPTLQEILAIIGIAAGAAQVYAPLTGDAAPEVAAGSAIAQSLLLIAQKASIAYESHVGAPLDLSLLHKIDPVP